MPYVTTKVHQVQGLTGKIYFVNKEEAGDKLISLQRYEYERRKYETKYEEVFDAAGLKIMAVSLDLDNSEDGVEADILFLDTKATLHRLHFTRGESKPIHTFLKLSIDGFDELMKSCQRFHASRQTISLGQNTLSNKTGVEVYKTEHHAIAQAMTGSTNLMLVEASDDGK